MAHRGGGYSGQRVEGKADYRITGICRVLSQLDKSSKHFIKQLKGRKLRRSREVSPVIAVQCKQIN